MPFGDSITASFQPWSSYRCYLDHSLNAAGISFIYAGSRTTDSYGNVLPPCGTPLTTFDPRNEGYSGAMAWDFLYNTTWGNTIDDILSRDIAGTAKTNIPDIVLMHLGTNDLNQGHSIPQITSDLGSLIDHFRAKNWKVIILIAQIIPCGPPMGGPWCNNVPSLNAAIPTLATQKNQVNSPVVVVDQYTGFDVATDTADGLHANSSGDAKMAARWMEKVQTWWNYSFQEFFIPMISQE